MFVLDATEKLGVVTICDHLRQLKYSRTQPTAFTEHGAIMVAAVRQLALAPARSRCGIGFTADLGD
jgi:hypothetical protein